MSTAINTAKVTGRRELHFDSLDDILADVELLAKSKDIRTLGNWSSGQVLQHLAIVMNGSIDGISHQLPGPVKFLFRLFLKRRFLSKTMPAGFKLPERAAAIIPAPTSLEEGLQSIRLAIQRLKIEADRSPNPVLGSLTREEWDELHCRHAELHLSFLVRVA